MSEDIGFMKQRIAALEGRVLWLESRLNQIMPVQPYQPVAWPKPFQPPTETICGTGSAASFATGAAL